MGVYPFIWLARFTSWLTHDLNLKPPFGHSYSPLPQPPKHTITPHFDLSSSSCSISTLHIEPWSMIEKIQPILYIPKDLALNLTVFKSLVYTKISQNWVCSKHIRLSNKCHVRRGRNSNLMCIKKHQITLNTMTIVSRNGYWNSTTTFYWKIWNEYINHK